MRLYIAGLYNSGVFKGNGIYNKFSPNMKALRDQVSHHLESYHYIGKSRSQIRGVRSTQEKIFLDSGAFSAFSLGVNVDIEEYAEFVKGHQDIIEMASVLDAIGDHEGTYRNQNILERLGAEVLPCFHYGEPFDLCEYYVKNYDYITIGGMVPVPNDKLVLWLDEVWEKVLTDKDGFARTKVHGFGLTSRPLMAKYPWYSCDSSSWVQAAANGSILLPEINRAIPISARSPNIKKWGSHFDTFPEESKNYILRLLDYYGLKLEEVRDTHTGRWALNCFTYDRLGKEMGPDHWRKPFKAKRRVLF